MAHDCVLSAFFIAIDGGAVMTEETVNPETKKGKKMKDEAKPKKKRKFLATILLISLLMNLALGAVLNYKWNDDSEYKDIFRTEISFAIQRFEEVDKKYEQSNYMVGVAHLYTACAMTAEFEETNIYNQNYNEFYDLWNMAASNPTEFHKYLDKLIPVLKDMKKDRNFNDSDALIVLQEVNSLMRVNVTK